MTPLTDYVALWNSLDEPNLACRVAKVAAPGIRFKDPFNDVTGVDRFRAVLDHSVEMMNEIRFEVHQEAWQAEQGFLHWTMTGTLRRGGNPVEINGVSLVKLDADGRVVEHIDHWDAGEQLYEKLPVLGTVLRWVKRKLSV